MNKQSALTEAIAIVKEYARGGGSTNLDYVLEHVYDKIIEISKKEGILFD